MAAKFPFAAVSIAVLLFLGVMMGLPGACYLLTMITGGGV